MKEIKVGEKTLLLVEVPEGAFDFEVTENLFHYWDTKLIGGAKEIPSGSWLLLGKGDEISEEQAKEIVEPSCYRGGEYNFALGHHQSSGWHKGFKDYEINKYGFLFDTPKESFFSLLRSHNYEPSKTVILIKQ